MYKGYISLCDNDLPPDHHTVHHCPVGGVWGVSLKEDQQDMVTLVYNCIVYNSTVLAGVSVRGHSNK